MRNIFRKRSPSDSHPAHSTDAASAASAASAADAHHQPVGSHLQVPGAGPAAGGGNAGNSSSSSSSSGDGSKLRARSASPTSVAGAVMSAMSLSRLSPSKVKESKEERRLSKAAAKEASDKAAKRIWESQNAPTNILDLSECGIDELPSETNATCNTFRKDILLAHSNRIAVLPPSIAQLTKLTILDLHRNGLEVIPPEIGQLVSLKSLDLSFNHIRSLPPQIGNLSRLYALRLRDNQLTHLPQEILSLQLLSLDLRDNFLTQLPANMYQMTTLQELDLIGNHSLDFPQQNVIALGTRAIMQALCTAKGVEYVLQTHVVMADVAQASPGFVTSSGQVSALSFTQAKQAEDEALIERHMRERQLEKERVQQRQLDRDREFEEQVRQQRALDDHMRELRSQNFAAVLAENDRHSEVMATAHMKTQLQQQKLLIEQILNASNVESSAIQISLIRLEEERIGLAIQERIQKDKKLLEAEIARACDASEKRRLDEMRRALHEREAAEEKMEASRVAYEQEKAAAAKRAEQMQAEFQKFVDGTLTDKADRAKALHDKLQADQSRYQEEFVQWQFARDAMYQQINMDIFTLQEDLGRLAVIVRQKRDERNDADVDLLTEEQHRLYHKMCMLVEQQRAREGELRVMLTNMDAEYKQQQKDLWCHEFAKLLARRPADVDFSEQEQRAYASQCNPSVLRRLAKLKLEHLAPIFGREHIDKRAWKALTDVHLQTIGVTALGDRLRILTTL
ncbi:hypothetical protein CAOG_02143 [Capsaspora owczarzaki ATCC 30864]|uniref:Uncharacterized protein n=1 Tax=Capsaspora owczarzaki (strain ATCC 30864) TaxID=595528 RepID=A0A0D2WKQ0_CAPO3|nr:hypothetical protein CAOG_02143 [Capsaspora owczarzaki ATCC 30864]KJE90910.1 hypothetical protein CAOG_002143 [Capsaspora owczarzaki ATCC 30864]|eukprot:XP_004348893.1 hypothetical protein CAOG_02143 [Capsaspora owczarzaki ATCC 30864]